MWASQGNERGNAVKVHGPLLPALPPAKSYSKLAVVLSDRILLTYGKKINSPRPLLNMATCDTAPRVSTLFHCVLFSNSFLSPRRLQRPTLKASATEVLVD